MAIKLNGMIWDYSAMAQLAKQLGGPEALMVAMERQGMAKGAAGTLGGVVVAVVATCWQRRRTRKLIEHRGGIKAAMRAQEARTAAFEMVYGDGTQAGQVVERTASEAAALGAPLGKVSVTVDLDGKLDTTQAMALDEAMRAGFGEAYGDLHLRHTNQEGTGRVCVVLETAPGESWEYMPVTDTTMEGR
ncbi:MAG: hypothetical protein UHD09_07055 [Bifidobacterium sp.]|nr:hypothetical protein [Bifidobacterium sp.]